MTIEETIEPAKVRAPKKRKPARKRAAPRPVPKPVAPTGIYAGMTVKDCCNACNISGCVISGKSYCAHPRKNGLHANEQQDEGAMRRRREAEKFLGDQKLIIGAT